MEKVVKVGFIGLSMRGRDLLSAFLSDKKTNVKITAMCDLDEKKIADCKEYLEKEHNITDAVFYTDYKEMLKSDVEAVIVATDRDTHSIISSDAMYAGKHVLCEIPNIKNYDDARLLIKAVKDNPKSKFMVAENCCYWLFIQTWKKMYEDGLLGDIVCGEADYIHPSTQMKLDPEKDTAPMTWRSFMPSIHYPTHDLGPLLYIMGDTCTEITGFEPDFNPLEKFRPANPNGMLIAKTKKGAMIKIFVGFGLHKTNGCHNFVMYGTKGSVENERFGPFHKRGTIADLVSIPNMNHGMTLPVGMGDFESESGHGGGDLRMMNDFIDCIINDREPDLGLEFGLNIAIPGLLAHLSAEQGGKTFKMPTMEEIMNGTADPEL